MHLPDRRFVRVAALAGMGISAIGCAPTTVTTPITPELHVIGIYQGETPPGVDDRPWWAKCKDDRTERAMLECHARYADQATEKEVVVYVSENSKPIVLALTAYDKTHWKVSLKKGVNITKVILGGYHSQRVSGVPEATVIETYTHDPSPCPRCWQSGNYFYSYENPPQQLRSITGLEVSTFQGRYKGSEFSIYPGLKRVK